MRFVLRIAIFVLLLGSFPVSSLAYDLRLPNVVMRINAAPKALQVEGVYEDAEGHLFGIIPVRFQIMKEVRTDGGVTLQQPWFSVFLREPFSLQQTSVSQASTSE